MTHPSANAWRCTVCGYIHRGTEPPESCPVCGAPRKFFEPFAESVEEETETPSNQWRCLVCNYDHSGDTPPEKCPVCGASKKKFERISAKIRTTDDTGKDMNVVVIGGGIAGVAAVEAMRQVSQKADITLISKESHLPYFRLNLTRLLAGEIKSDRLPVHPESWYSENRITLIKGAEASDISLTQKQVKVPDGSVYPFDKLILTAGAHPFIPPYPGINREGVTPLRTIDDASYIKAEASKAESVVVVGGGILGLETAGAIVKYAKKVTVIEGFDYLMPRQLPRKAAARLETLLAGMGINLKTGAEIKELAGDERVKGVILKTGETIPADLVIFSTGVRSNSYLARVSGLQVNQGIIVDDNLQSSHPDIYAAGDIAEHRGVVYGLWNAAQYQGTIAGMNAIGKTALFGGIPRSNTIKVLGIDLFSIGKFEADDGSFIVIEKEDEAEYIRFVFHDTHLVGAILYGNTTCSAAIKQAIETKRDFSKTLLNQATVERICDILNG
ncbi:MAG: FAD-dependent oxidoreductase [Proteobacteria bacterium]|nr:FAD-dependent oxidoreductase [Pseudomonadota bacterium]